eukprot:SAG25_NODE_1002_length_4348_cov_7.069663_2_plen_60_part_00
MVSGVSGILLPVSATRPIGNNQFGMHEAHVDPESALAKSVKRVLQMSSAERAAMGGASF